jgi:hypothetical protein
MERIATAEGSAASLKRPWTTGYLNQEIDDPIVLAPTSSGVILRSVSVTPLRGRAFRLVLGNCHDQGTSLGIPGVFQARPGRTLR